MEKIKIYGVDNRSGYENVYVFQGHEPQEESFDEFEVELPEGYKVHKSIIGENLILTDNRYLLTILEAFRPGVKPVLSTVNSSGYPVTMDVNYRRVNDRKRYNPMYL